MRDTNPVKRILLRTAASLFAFLAITGASNATEYDIELVVFQNLESRTTELSQVNAEIQAGYDQEIQRLFSKTGSTVALPVTVGYLTEVSQTLIQDPAYVLLQHVTWRQEALSISNSPYVDVSALSLGDESGLKGLVRFYQSPLLYVDVFLKYTPFQDLITDSDESRSDSGLNTLPASYLIEKRRLRLKEIHYLDHPEIGAIISVWPIENSE